MIVRPFPVALGLALALAVPAAADARPREIADFWATHVHLRSDGQRFSAWTAMRGPDPVGDRRRAFVRDSRTGRTRSFVAPRGCMLGLVAAGVGTVACGDGFGLPRRLVRLETLRLFRLRTTAGARRWLQSAGVMAFGRRWIRLRRCPRQDHPCTYGYVNWRTGAFQRRDDHNDEHGPNPRYDLDSRELRPYARRVPRIYYGSRFSEAGLTLATRRRQVRLDTCQEICNHPQLGAGLATWASNRRAFGYRLSDGRRFEWRFRELADQPPNQLSALSVAHTGSEVLFAVPHGPSADGRPHVRLYLERR